MDAQETNDEQLKKKLTPEEYRALREGGTEPPFSGTYLKPAQNGTYRCKACDAALFKVETQEEPSSAPGLAGWPSFNDAIPDALTMKHDTSLGMERTEVLCAQCGSHLGHLFDDPSTQTGKHFCINSICLNLDTE